MGIFDKVKGVFGRKKKVEPPPVRKLEPIEPLPLTRPEDAALTPRGLPPPREPLPPPPRLEPLTPRFAPDAERIDTSNLKAKIDLLLTEMDSIKTQNRMIDERLKKIENTLTEMRGIRYY